MSDNRREFSIHRYNSYNRDRVLGKIPFFAEGPNCRLRKNAARKAIRDIYGEGTSEDKEEVAEFMLEEGLVSALWAVSMRGCVSPEDRREIEIRELAKELGPVPWHSHAGFYWDLADAAWEYMDSIATVEMRRHYVAEDGIELR